MLELTYIEPKKVEILRSSAKFIFKDCERDQAASSEKVEIPDINASW